MSLAPVNIAISDEAELERRAVALARDEVEREAAPAGSISVTFQLGAARCALEATAVERAVLRLGEVFAIPLAGGGDRAATFVDERPVPVVDLVRPGREIEALRQVPALLVAVESGSVAVAVEAPLDLSDAPLVATAEPAPTDGDEPRLAGRLSDGSALLDTNWIRRFAARAFEP
jgi:hypothetical protein